jgi:hypothetical protein
MAPRIEADPVVLDREHCVRSSPREMDSRVLGLRVPGDIGQRFSRKLDDLV